MIDSVTVRRQKIRKDHTRKRFVFFLLVTAVFLIVVCFARQFCPYDPNAQVFSALEPPSVQHPAGTDRFGRDMLSRILIGLRTSVLSTLTLVAIITAAGTVIGVLCGHLGGAADALMMRVADVCLAFPGLVLALAEAAAPRIAACRGLIGPPAAVLFHSGRWRGRAIISSVGGRIPGCAAWGLAVACLARRWRRLGTTGGACLAGLAPHIA